MPKPTKKDLVAQLLADDPGLSLHPTVLAILASCHRGHLNRMTIFREARDRQRRLMKAAKAAYRAELPRGFKDKESDGFQETIRLDARDTQQLSPLNILIAAEEEEQERQAWLSY